MRIRYKACGQRLVQDQQLVGGGATSHPRAHAPRKPEVGGTPGGIHTCKRKRKKQSKEEKGKRKEKKRKHKVELLSSRFSF
jgi:hypothetical protein